MTQPLSVDDLLQPLYEALVELKEAAIRAGLRALSDLISAFIYEAVRGFR